MLKNNRKSPLFWSIEKIKTAKRFIESNTKISEIARICNVSKRSVNRLIKKMNCPCSLMEPEKPGRKPSDDSNISEEIQNILNSDNSLTLDMINNRLSTKKTPSYLSRLLKKMNWSRKRLQKSPQERNSESTLEKRRTFVSNISHVNLEKIIYLDETGFNLHQTSNFGWAPANITPYVQVPASKGNNLSVLMAIRHNGVICYEKRKGPFDSGAFVEFLQKMLPYLRPDSVIIMDNARIHHARIVKEFIQQNNMCVEFLPPYSPMLNPIEEVFSLLKRKYNQIRPRAEKQSELENNVENALRHIMDSNFINFYRHSTEFYDACFNKLELL